MHSRYNRNKSTRVVKKSNSWYQLFFAFILGYLFAYIFNLETLVNMATRFLHKDSTNKHVRIVKEHIKSSEEPKYEFYTMLQKNESEVINSNIKIETNSADPLTNHNKIVETQNTKSSFLSSHLKLKAALRFEPMPAGT